MVLSLLFGDCSSYHILGSKCFHLSFPEFQASRRFRHKPPFKSSQGLNLILFILQFYLNILLWPVFVTVARHDLIHSSSVHLDSCSRRSSIFFLLLKVQLILRILLKWSFAFLRSFQLPNHFHLWPVITLWSWDVTYKNITSLFFSLLIFSTTPFKPPF